MYKATLLDSKTKQTREIIVKVRHPHVVDNIATDLRIIRSLGGLVCILFNH